MGFVERNAIKPRGDRRHRLASGQKFFDPAGIGALRERLALLEAMPPYSSFGDMIATVRT